MLRDSNIYSLYHRSSVYWEQDRHTALLRNKMTYCTILRSGTSSGFPLWNHSIFSICYYYSWWSLIMNIPRSTLSMLKSVTRVMEVVACFNYNIPRSSNTWSKNASTLTYPVIYMSFFFIYCMSKSKKYRKKFQYPPPN